MLEYEGSHQKREKKENILGCWYPAMKKIMILAMNFS
jgi:hypothetical protein